MRLIDANALRYKNLAEVNGKLTYVLTAEEINNAPTIETDIEVVAKDAYEHGYTDGWKERFGEPDERPQGEWVVERLQNGFDDVYCPFCNARPTRSEYGYYLKDNFCHECGAKMVKQN